MKDESEQLRRVGLRITEPRQQVLRLLSRAAHPLSVEEMYQLTHRTIDRATLYRMMRSFCSAHLVTTVELRDNKCRYELRRDYAHHHHVVCTKCGITEDVTGICRSSLNERVQEQSNFASIRDHALEFFGLCRSCAL